jgi:tetratricopeptide (TPR) repeat protein/serine phosphatase RsbU (regulator of sigma subunit)
MKQFVKNLLLLLLVATTFFGFSQQPRIDSLLTILIKSNSDTTRLGLYIKIGKAYEEVSADSASNYYQKAINLGEQIAPNTNSGNYKFASALKLKSLALHQFGNLKAEEGEFNLALENYTKALAIRETIDDKTEIFNTLNQMGIAYFYLSEYEKAIEIFEKELNISKELNDRIKIAKSYTNLGVIYRNQGHSDRALENYISSLIVYEELNHTPGMSTCYNNIGVIHWNEGNYDLAIEYYQKALDIYKKTNDRNGIAKSYNNIGVVYDDMKNTPKALEYYKQAIELYKALGEKHGLSAIYNNMGVIYKIKAEKASSTSLIEVYVTNAIDYYKKSLDIAKELADKSGIALIEGNLASLYLLLGQSTNNRELLRRTVNYALSAYKISIEIGSIPYQNDFSSHLMNAYRSLGDTVKAFKFAEIYIKTRQTLFNSEKSKALADAEAQFQSEKKQQEIDRQRILLENQLLEASRQRTYRNGVILALVLSLLLTIIAFRGYRLKKSKNRIITEKNAILEQANAEILTQSDELKAQRDMVMKQNRELGEMHSHITNSLQYAQSIQAAILPSETVIEQISKDYFVLIKPCELVSGDFFWAASFDCYQIFCIADCTGHGVPGAFMSILGITALNDIVTRHRITKPDEILRLLRENVIEALSQNDPHHLHKDGIDLAICVFNTKTRELQYSGAGIPLWMVVKNSLSEIIGDYPKTSLNGLSLFDIKSNSTPVGQSPILKPFINHSFALKDIETRIYLITDGFADQFNEINRKKYMVSRLKSLVLENCSNSMAQQKLIFENEFTSWMGSSYQVDDVAVLGIMLNGNEPSRI